MSRITTFLTTLAAALAALFSRTEPQTPPPEAVEPAPTPAVEPTRKYPLSAGAKRLILAGLSSEDRASAERQIAEHDGEREYYIRLSCETYQITKGEITWGAMGAEK